MRSSARSRDATYTLHSESLWHRTQLGLIYDDDVAMLSIFSANNSAICTPLLHKTHRGQETHHTHCKSSQDTAICSSPGKLSVGRVYVLRLYGYVNILLSWLCPLQLMVSMPLGLYKYKCKTMQMKIQIQIRSSCWYISNCLLAMVSSTSKLCHLLYQS